MALTKGEAGLINAMRSLLNNHEEELSAIKNEKTVVDPNTFSANLKAFKIVSVKKEIQNTKDALKKLEEYKAKGIKKIMY